MRCIRGIVAFRSGSDLVHVADTFLTDIFAMVDRQPVGGAAENAGRFKLLQDDLIVFQIDLQFIPLCNVQRPAKLNGKHDSSQFVHLSNDTSRLQQSPLLS